MQPSLSFENNNNNNEKNDEMENPHLLNILNWSLLDNLATNKTTLITTNDENESKSKNGYNAVQISIELQKKMLKYKKKIFSKIFSFVLIF
jgi:hypothetical protein